ncbi:hypothetical protein [Pseudohoeflea coraliihabitans]|uniref:Uncharacterized protein n=1 Tax=Pseudohoeflea coraliihabitans TaxID=2860393 RepID=A0ABS6WLL5_9HYPH|nr:hypothetical protein [Pseudohoeflea sp. DP4N28-3]MBW3096848.1 hypothetical protein [Pseudohoeflea sp. DP4N28-3]
MNRIDFHRVTKIELARESLHVSGCRAVLVTWTDWRGNEQTAELTFFGNTEALAPLPRSEDFRETFPRTAEAAE